MQVAGSSSRCQVAAEVAIHKPQACPAPAGLPPPRCWKGPCSSTSAQRRNQGGASSAYEIIPLDGSLVLKLLFLAEIFARLQSRIVHAETTSDRPRHLDTQLNYFNAQAIMTASMQPEAALSPLPKADGSATYCYAGYNITASANGPIEAQRRDEHPYEALVDVVVRPASGVGGEASLGRAPIEIDEHVAHLPSFSQAPGNGISRHCCSSLCDSSFSSRTFRAASYRSSCKSQPLPPTNTSTRN